MSTTTRPPRQLGAVDAPDPLGPKPPWSASLKVRTGLRVGAAALVAAAAAVTASWFSGSLYVSGLVGLTLAAIGGYLVARWSTAPVHRLLAWAAEEDMGYLRFLTGDEWQTLARLLFVRRRDALARADEAESDLAHQNAILLTMADGVLVTDAQGRLLLANGAAEAMFGITRAGASGHTVLESTMSVPLEEAVLRALATGESQSRDIGVPYPVPRHLRAVVSASGSDGHRAAVIVLHDLTDAVRVDAMRRDFVANVSHELRNPVAGIMMNAENLLNGAMDDGETARNAVSHIASSARRLASLVDDLLSLASAEARTVQDAEAVPLGPVVRAVVAELDPVIAAKRLDVSITVPDEAIVHADTESVRQILHNLLDNAVKYIGEDGSVEINAATADGRVRIDISDTGIGIPRQHQDRVFERFYRVDPARSREAGGTGLGLSIVKHLVESLGGTVTLSSEPERGSTFTVELPSHG